MVCPRCGAEKYGSKGGKQICPQCGHGSSMSVPLSWHEQKTSHARTAPNGSVLLKCPACGHEQRITDLRQEHGHYWCGRCKQAMQVSETLVRQTQRAEVSASAAVAAEKLTPGSEARDAQARDARPGPPGKALETWVCAYCLSMHTDAFGSRRCGFGYCDRPRQEIALGSITAAHIEALIHDSNRHCFATKDTVKQVGQLAIKPLIIGLRDHDAKARKFSAWCLGEIGNTKAVSALISALEDDDWEVRCNVASALGQIGDRRATEPLMKSIRKGEYRDEDYAIAQALGSIGDVRALEVLVEVSGPDEDGIDHGDNAVRKVLRSVDQATAVRKLLKLLEHSQPLVRRHVARLLGDVGDMSAVPALRGLASFWVRQRKDVKEAARKAVEKINLRLRR